MRWDGLAPLAPKLTVFQELTVFVTLFYYFLTTKYFSFFKKILYIYLFLERGEGKEKEKETSVCGCLSHAPSTEDLACNPGMCPEWESNQQLFGSQARAQFPELHQQGQYFSF